MRCRFIQDGDGHWYLVPSDRYAEAERMFSLIEDFYNELPDCVPPPEPDFVERIDGVGSWSFTDPREVG
jgi:hypothetical protein